MPGLRENIDERLTHEPVIDPEFQALIPPLTPYELAELEASILKEGCRDAIVLWDNTIIDGHNRYRICKAHSLPYKTKSMDFASRREAMLWMLQNQLARRNLNDFQRIEIVKMYEAAVKNRAKARQSVYYGNQYGSGLRENLPEVQNGTVVREKLPEREVDPMENLPQGRANDELGAMAGVSRKTYEHAVEVLAKASAPVLEAVRKGELSIDAAYRVINLPQEVQDEVAARISKGERPRNVVSMARKMNKKYSMRYWNSMLKNAEQAADEAPDLDAIIELLNETLNFLKEARQKKNG